MHFRRAFANLPLVALDITNCSDRPRGVGAERFNPQNDFMEQTQPIKTDRASVPFTVRGVQRLPSSLRRPGFCARLKLMSGQFRSHDLTSLQAAEVCARATDANQKREGERDPRNCMSGWEPFDAARPVAVKSIP